MGDRKLGKMSERLKKKQALGKKHSHARKHSKEPSEDSHSHHEKKPSIVKKMGSFLNLGGVDSGGMRRDVSHAHDEEE